MAKLNFAKAFELTLDDGEKKPFKAGLQNVPDALVDHWFIQAHVAPADEDEEAEGSEGGSDNKSSLIAMAEDLGIKVDGRWSEDKLVAAIEEAEAKKTAEGSEGGAQ